MYDTNSVQLPYYPGKRPDDLEFQLSAAAEQRRYDGQLGRFNYTVAPQYYNERRPWLAFLPQISQLSDFDLSARTECTPLIRVWDVDSDRPYQGRLRDEFVTDLNEVDTSAMSRMRAVGTRIYRDRLVWWNERPMAPVPADFKELRAASTFEQAVDLGRRIQQGILEKQAWCTMAETWLEYRDRERTLAATQVVPVRDKYLGVWIHGIPEDCLKFFLGHARVLCFLIHELTANETPGDLTMEDFVQGTAIAPLLDWQRSEYD
ncbi:hypothetical protein K438DRAFT_1967821 [Mycena galopus ATCC 62051]|nr:hypothetical protein K438DRAFT_1967821 [Mycena galopus ATCC 62051]